MGAAARQPAPAGDVVINGTTATFVQDVLEASTKVPVIVDFWATWCGPCKTLGPTIERLVREAKGAVRLVKIDVDRNQDLAAQMRIQSIPAVYAFKDGRPVDGFVGALPESQVRAFIQRLTAGQAAPGDGIDEALAVAKELFEQKDFEGALDVYQQIVDHDKTNIPATAGLLRCLLQLGEKEQVRQALAALPPEMAGKPEIAAIRTALDLAEQAGKAGPAADLERRVAASPDDHQARFDLAMALFAAGEREGAVDNLLELVRRNRGWNEEAGRKQLVKFFEAFGPTDPLTVSGRKRLSSLLFS